MQSWEEKILIKQAGIAEGEQIGRLKEKTELVKKLSNKFSIEQIAEMLEIDISEVEKIIKEKLLFNKRDNINIVAAKLFNDAGIIGAGNL